VRTPSADCGLSQGANYPETGMTSGTSSGTTFLHLGPRGTGGYFDRAEFPKQRAEVARSAEPPVANHFSALPYSGLLREPVAVDEEGVQW